MEGLRALREYTEESEKDLPDREALHRLLDDAIECFEKCEARNREDILPLYSLALALTMRNQLHYAKMLLDRGKLHESLAEVTPALAQHGELYEKAGRDQLLLSLVARFLTPEKDQEDPEVRREILALLSAPPGPRKWPLLDRAGELFQFVQQKSQDITLKTAAMFNLAHVYAKHDEVPDQRKSEADTDGNLRKAKDLLEKLKEEIYSSTAFGDPLQHVYRRPWWRRWWRALRRLAGRAWLWIASRLKRIDWRQTDSKAREEFDESKTIPLQIEALLKWVSLRIDLPNVSIASIEGHTKTAGEKIRDEKNIPSSLKNDLIADLQTKMGFLLYERAFAVQGDREAALKKAEEYLVTALELKKNWKPTLIYLAQVLQAQGRFDEADRCLQTVLGVETLIQQKLSVEGVPPQDARADYESNQSGR